MIQSAVYEDEGSRELPRVYKRRALQHQSSRKARANRQVTQVTRTATDETAPSCDRFTFPRAAPKIKPASNKHENRQQYGGMKMLAPCNAHRIGVMCFLWTLTLVDLNTHGPYYQWMTSDAHISSFCRPPGAAKSRPGPYYVS